MIIRLAFYLVILFVVVLVAYALYNRLPAILYPILAKIAGENVHDQLGEARRELVALREMQDKKDALIHELDLSAQVHGYPEITRPIDRFRRENPSDSLERRY